MARKISNLSASYMGLCLVEFYTLFRIQGQDLASLDINKKRGSSINLDIHYSKVFSSDYIAKQNKFFKIYIFFSRYLVINLELDICLVKYKKQVNYKVSSKDNIYIDMQAGRNF